jgi:hypothetical protein
MHANARGYGLHHAASGQTGRLLWHYLLASRCFASAVCECCQQESNPRMTRANRWRYKSEPETVSERSGHSDYLRVLRVSALHLRFHSCFGWNRPMPGPEDPRASERKNVRDTTRANSKARSRMGPTPPDRHNRAATSLPRNPQRPYHAATSNGGNHALDRPARTPSRHPCPQHHAHRARTANTVRRRADDREHPTPSVTQKPRSSRRPTVRLITPKRHQHWTQR